MTKALDQDIADLRALDKEIESLRARNRALENALMPFAIEANLRHSLGLGPDIDHWPIGGSNLTLGDLRRARLVMPDDRFK